MFSFYQNDSMESEKTQTHRNQIQKNHPTPQNKTGTEIHYIQITLCPNCLYNYLSLSFLKQNIQEE